MGVLLFGLLNLQSVDYKKWDSNENYVMEILALCVRVTSVSRLLISHVTVL